MSTIGKDYPVTPDGRYFIVGNRLWRMTDPNLDFDRRDYLIRELMTARRAVGTAVRNRNRDAEQQARADVDAAKTALGERGQVWWDDGAPDYNRRSVGNSPYAEWFGAIGEVR